MYKSELDALKKAGRFRERKIYDDVLIDCMSNDYLGLANNKEQFEKAVNLVREYESFAPKSSMLVGGYHRVHKIFEDEISTLNGFESAITVGSGFLANMALIESLVRKKDFLLIDEEYHASGIVALQMIDDRYMKFRHNCASDLRIKLLDIKRKLNPKRIIIAIEGIYSMSGDICTKELFDIADEFGAILIVDEAHSSGTIGGNLLGVFDYYGITPKANHIKMGTLGKAYGSYGAYILASRDIISFLENRAKSIIYTTSLSVFDTALALVNLRYIHENAKRINKEISDKINIANEILNIKTDSLIVPIKVKDNHTAIEFQKLLQSSCYLIGAIRQPTVNHPILRVILRCGVSTKSLKELFLIIKRLELKSI